MRHTDGQGLVGTIEATLNQARRRPQGRTMRLIGARQSAVALLVILGALIVFHVLVLAGALPPDIAWGGRAAGSPRNMVDLEAIAISLTALFAAAVAAKAGFIGGPRVRRLSGVAVWVVFGYFVLNVLGNLASSSSLERAIFTPVSAVVALLALRLALDRQPGMR